MAHLLKTGLNVAKVGGSYDKGMKSTRTRSGKLNWVSDEHMFARYVCRKSKVTATSGTSIIRK